MGGPKELDDVEAAAWRAFVVFWRQGFPQLERTFRRVGLNHLEYGFLAVLSERSDGSMPAGELAELAGITSSRLSHRLKQLEAAGDIERRPDPYDRRGVIVAITGQGRDKVDAVFERHLDDVRRLVFDHLSADQTRELRDVMIAITSALTDHDFLPKDDHEPSSTDRD